MKIKGNGTYVHEHGGGFSHSFRNKHEIKQQKCLNKFSKFYFQHDDKKKYIYIVPNLLIVLVHE